MKIATTKMDRKKHLVGLWVLIGISAAAQAAMVFTLPTNWANNQTLPTNVVIGSNPYDSEWAVYNQAANAGQTGAYTLGTYQPYDTSTWFGGYGAAGQGGRVHVTAGTATFLTWSNGTASGPKTVLAFTVPTGYSGLATLSGVTTTNSPAFSTYVQVYKLNAAGTVSDQKGFWGLSTLSTATLSFDFSNVSVVPGDRLMVSVWNSNAGNSQSSEHLTLQNYTITIPEPATAALCLLGLGTLTLLRKKRA